MAFRYINPGYAESLNEPNGSTTVYSEIYNPANGIAIKAPDSRRLTILPAGHMANIIYCRADVFPTGNVEDITFKLGFNSTYSSSDSYISGIHSMYGNIYIKHNNTQYTGTSGKLKLNELNTLFFSINYEDCTATCTLNGETITAQDLSSSRYYNENSSFIVTLPSNSTRCYYLSNLMVSDEYISPKEKLITLPIKATETDMTEENGLYIADAANQILLQTPDVAELIEDYGANSQITGIQVAANPAYKTATGLTSLTALSKADSIITEHGTLLLSDDTGAVVSTGWAVENMTISDLQNMQFGWKAGE